MKDKRVTKWRVIRGITICVVILFFIVVTFYAIKCMNMSYPQLMMEIEITNWFNKFCFDMVFILLIISIVKIKELNNLN